MGIHTLAGNSVSAADLGSSSVAGTNSLAARCSLLAGTWVTAARTSLVAGKSGSAVDLTSLAGNSIAAADLFRLAPEMWLHVYSLVLRLATLRRQHSYGWHCTHGSSYLSVAHRSA